MLFVDSTNYIIAQKGMTEQGLGAPAAAQDN